MGHDTHGHSTENKAIISFGNGLWLVIILVGLFIAALNFVQVESASEGHGEATHETHHGAAGGHEAAPAAHHDAAPKNETHEAEGAHHNEEMTAPVGEGAETGNHEQH
ncbi:hypothetical protein GCM10023093_24520 [Nemorincola caseinilytica]|uniref:Uncharacterized protein n=1 Tax=Nemorincola caseinilytica TaxID=2054315 RepID=A0ABP8NLP8_9BACT